MATPTNRAHKAQQRRAARRMAAERAATRRQFLRIGSVVAIVLVIVFSGIWIAFSQSDGDVASGAGLYDELPTTGMVLGDPDAPATLVEYADYLCPHCADFVANDQSRLIEDFVRTGKLKYEFRPMPVLGGAITDPTNQAVRFAEASMCALDQGQFWEYHDLAFQPTIDRQPENLNDGYLKQIAGNLGLDQQAFDSCFDNRTHRQDVLDSYNEGVAQGVSGVPSFFLDGQMVPWTSGGYDAFKLQLDAFLAG
jgi:protein-disulfide isomerase